MNWNLQLNSPFQIHIDDDDDATSLKFLIEIDSLHSTTEVQFKCNENFAFLGRIKLHFYKKITSFRRMLQKYKWKATKVVIDKRDFQFQMIFNSLLIFLSDIFWSLVVYLIHGLSNRTEKIPIEKNTINWNCENHHIFQIFLPFEIWMYEIAS